MSAMQFYPFKNLIDRIQTTHYACRNLDLNLILVVAISNGFTFSIVVSLMKSMAVHLN